MMALAGATTSFAFMANDDGNSKPSSNEEIGPGGLTLNLPIQTTSTDENIESMNVENIRRSSSSPASSSYFRSAKFMEFVFCKVFFWLGILTELPSNTPHQRPIPVQYLESTGDYILRQTNTELLDNETIPVVLLVVLALVFPLVTQLILSCLRKRSLHDVVCVYLLGFGLNGMITNTLKLYVGYLRPVFFDICDPNDSYDVCQNEHTNEARKSFPSGHASFSFLGLTLLSFFLEHVYGLTAARIRNTNVMIVKTTTATSTSPLPVTSLNLEEGYGEVEAASMSSASSASERSTPFSPHNSVNADFTNRIISRKQLVMEYEDQSKKPIQFYRMISVLCYSPMALATYIAASRLVDNRHFPADVVGGSIIGYAVAALVHSIWYSSWPIMMKS